MKLYYCNGMKIESESGKIFTYNCTNILEQNENCCSTCKDILEDLKYIKERKTEIYQLFKLDWNATRLKIPIRRRKVVVKSS